MQKLFIYNFHGYIYESHEAFDSTYRQLMREAKANGEKVTRQVICGDKISNQYYHPGGIWLDEEN